MLVCRWSCLFILAAGQAALEQAPAGASDPPATESTLVKLLRSGRVPDARQGLIVEMIGKRGTAADLAFIYEQVLAHGAFPASVRVKALDALADAASNRQLRPPVEMERLVALFSAAAPRSDVALARSAIRLAGLWKLEGASDALGELAATPSTDDRLRAEALDALARIGGRAGRSRIEALAAPGAPIGTQLLAIAALTKLDVVAAAERAALILSRPPAPGCDLTPLLAAFLSRQGGGDALATALGRQPLPADSAKLALRAVYALGRADPGVVAALARAAGISTEIKPLTPEELNQLVADVASRGDPARGEQVFRGADLNCMSCHALAKAGGDVGPDLSALGQTSPPDYIISSILDPDQAIKEQYHTLLVLTSDGQVVQGIVTDKDDQRIVLKDATGTPRVVPVATIEDQKPGGSLMPKGLANLMTRAEFLDLVRFLSELGKPGPYGIRANPAIQRWRVRKQVPEALSSTIPDPDLLREQFLHAEPDRWATAYAQVAGSLPLDELRSTAGGPVVYLQGEIDVSAAGEIRLQVDARDGTVVWIDDQPAPSGAGALEKTLATGRHSITLRVDTKARKSHQITLEVTKPAGSTAEYTVVGGR
jgi:putative heme-binding domain-containing protein